MKMKMKNRWRKEIIVSREREGKWREYLEVSKNLLPQFDNATFKAHPLGNEPPRGFI